MFAGDSNVRLDSDDIVSLAKLVDSRRCTGLRVEGVEPTNCTSSSLAVVVVEVVLALDCP